MKYAAIIQARYDSSRLPAKALTKIVGKPVLQHVIERARYSKLVDEVLVATSMEKSNLPLISLCAGLGIRVYAGSENDVLDRYYQISRLLAPEYVIRITADCPLFDGRLLDEAIEKLEPSTDYLGMISHTFADGLDIEIIKSAALRKAWREASLQSQREHVTQYIIHHPELFVLQDFQSTIGDFGDHRWTLDEPEDLVLINAVFEHFYSADNPEFSYVDVLAFLRRHPQIAAVNKRFHRNEGLEKSLAADRVVGRMEE